MVRDYAIQRPALGSGVEESNIAGGRVESGLDYRRWRESVLLLDGDMVNLMVGGSREDVREGVARV